jgi:LytS/YehU family sensor histidine kinase
VIGLFAMIGRGLFVALPIALAVVATYNRAPAIPARRYTALAAAVVLSSLAGAALAVFVESYVHGHAPIPFDNMQAAVDTFLRIYWLRYAMLGALFTAVYVYARIAEESAAQARQAELDRERYDQQIEEARLQVLQAQIEPHFLFNTLATVRRLYHTTPGSAVATLDNLMRYLSVALPQMRTGITTLGSEASLAEAYLHIQKLRMGRRLEFVIDVPQTLSGASMPPMMLLTLVENAIKHGLTPLLEGGFISVSARAGSGALEVHVADSGRGFAQTSGAGTGLANIRSRLAALYGHAARLELKANRPRGVTATITVPLTLPSGLATAA